jgi:hypothetical protein
MSPIAPPSIITITGSSFGPIGTSITGQLLGGDSQGLFTSSSLTSCSVTIADTTITCTAPTGSGTDYYVAITVGGQTVDAPDYLIAFTGPTLNYVTPFYVESASSIPLTINGAYFVEPIKVLVNDTIITPYQLQSPEIIIIDSPLVPSYVMSYLAAPTSSAIGVVVSVKSGGQATGTQYPLLYYHILHTNVFTCWWWSYY